MLISGLFWLFSDMLIASSVDSSLSIELSLKDTLRTLTGLGGTIRKGMPAKLSPKAGVSRSFESPLILRKLWEGEIVGVGCITLISICNVVSLV